MAAGILINVSLFLFPTFQITATPPDLIRFPILMGDASMREKILEAGGRMGLGISTAYPDSVESIKGLPIAGGYNRVSNAKQCAAPFDFTQPLFPQRKRF